MFACFRSVFKEVFKSVQPQKQASQQQTSQQQTKEIVEMTNGEAQGEGPQAQNPQAQGPTPSPVGEPSFSVGEAIAPETQQAQSEFSNIKQALTDRRASVEPKPGWILPRVDDRAAFSDPALNPPTSTPTQ